MEDYPVSDNFKRTPKMKPDVVLVGKDGNIFNILVLCKNALRKYPNAYNELQERVLKSGSYDKSLVIITEYLNIK